MRIRILTLPTRSYSLYTFEPKPATAEPSDLPLEIKLVTSLLLKYNGRRRGNHQLLNRRRGTKPNTPRSLITTPPAPLSLKSRTTTHPNRFHRRTPSRPISPVHTGCQNTPLLSSGFITFSRLASSCNPKASPFPLSTLILRQATQALFSIPD